MTRRFYVILIGFILATGSIFRLEPTSYIEKLKRYNVLEKETFESIKKKKIHELKSSWERLRALGIEVGKEPSSAKDIGKTLLARAIDRYFTQGVSYLLENGYKIYSDDLCFLLSNIKWQSREMREVFKIHLKALLCKLLELKALREVKQCIKILSALDTNFNDLEFKSENIMFALFKPGLSFENEEIMELLLENGWNNFKARNMENRSVLQLVYKSYGYLSTVRLFENKISRIFIDNKYNNEQLNRSIKNIVDANLSTELLIKLFDNIFSKMNLFPSEKYEFLLKLNSLGINNLPSAQKMLVRAVENRDERWVEKLVVAGTSVNTKTFCGEPIIFIAIKYGHSRIVEFLVQEGADINIREAGRTPLRYAFLWERIRGASARTQFKKIIDILKCAEAEEFRKSKIFLKRN